MAHTGRGAQYVSIRFTERLARAGIAASVESVGDSYDNALAETINGLYKTALMKPRAPDAPWRTGERANAVRHATAEYLSGSTTAAAFTITAATSRRSSSRTLAARSTELGRRLLSNQ